MSSLSARIFSAMRSHTSILSKFHISQFEESVYFIATKVLQSKQVSHFHNMKKVYILLQLVCFFRFWPVQVDSGSSGAEGLHMIHMEAGPRALTTSS